MMRFMGLLLSFCLTCASCSQVRDAGQSIVFRTGSIPELKVENMILRLPDGLILGHIEQVECDDTCIYVLNSMTDEAGVHVFEKSSGKYIGRIGQKGRGPGEYVIPLSFTIQEGVVCVVDGGRCGVHEYDKGSFGYIRFIETHEMNCFETSLSGVSVADVNEYDSDSSLYGKAFTTMNDAFICAEGYIDEPIISGYVTGPVKPMFRYDDAVRAYCQFVPIVYDFTVNGCSPVYNLTFEGLSFPDKRYLKRISSGNRDYTRALRESGFISYYDFFETESAILSMCIADGKRYFGIYSKSSGKGYIVNEQEIAGVVYADPLMMTGVMDGKFISTVEVDLLKGTDGISKELALMLSDASDNDILIQFVSL